MKKLKIMLTTFLLAAASVLLSSCYVRFPKELVDRIKSESDLVVQNGTDSTVSYDIPANISEFVIGGGFSKVVVIQVPQDSASKLILHSSSVCVSGGDTSSCLDFVEYKMEDGALQIRTTRNWNMDVDVVFHCHGLEEISKAGSGSLTIAENFTGNDLEVNMAGSGNLMAGNLFLNGKLDIGLAGSGNVKVSDISAESIEFDVAGSGDAFFGGTVKYASFEIAGSGKVDAEQLVASEDVTAKISGSGKITYNEKGRIVTAR